MTADAQPDPTTQTEPDAPVLSVVMPAYNEEATVLATIARVLSVPLELEPTPDWRAQYVEGATRRRTPRRRSRSTPPSTSC